MKGLFMPLGDNLLSHFELSVGEAFQALFEQNINIPTIETRTMKFGSPTLLLGTELVLRLFHESS